MKFIIVGYGRVGSRTARILAEEGHDVVVVDLNHDRVERARKEGLTAVEGDGATEETLLEAGIESADGIGALTPDLNANFSACMVGTHHGVRTVLRIDEDYREEIYRKYAEDVDEVIYPERLGAAGAKTAMLGGDFNVVADLAANLQLSVLEIPEGSPVIGGRITDVELPESAHVYAHGRAHEPLTIPLPGTTLEAGDQVAVIAETDEVAAVRAALGSDALEA